MKKIFFIAIVLFSSTVMFAQPVMLDRVTVTPTRVLLYWTNPPAKYSSQISPDKKKIILTIPNANASEAARTVHGKGVIQDVFALKNGKNLDINILLQEKRGYTIAKGNFSKSFVVDFFIWEKISPIEDNYRSGLLALENGIEETAKKYFRKADEKGNGDAAAQLGFLELKAGNTTEAIKFFRKAIAQQTTLHDTYAGLSQAYKLEGDDAKSAQFEKIFLQRTGVSKLSEENIPQTKISADSTAEPTSLLSDMSAEDIPAIDTAAVLDTAKIPQDTAKNTAKADSAKIPQAAAISDSTKKNSSEENFPSWVKNLAIGGILAFLAVVMLLGWLYKRWVAKIQAQKGTNPTPQAIPQPPVAPQPSALSMQDQPPAGQNFAGMLAHAANAYKQQESPGMPKPVETSPKTQTKAEEETSDEDDMSFVPEDPTEEKKKLHWLDEIEEDEKNSSEEKIPEQEVPQQLSGEAELALRLHEQQRIQKTQALHSLNNEKLPDDKLSLQEKAKKLGVEKGSIETKKNLHQIESDEERMEELRRKFLNKPGE